jgi:hypothetical protein
MRAMKNVKLTCELSVLFALFFSLSAFSINQDEKQDSFENTYKLNASGTLLFNVYNSDLKVNVWKNNEVKLAGQIIVTGGNAEDRESLIKAFKNPEVKTGENRLEINSEFWKNISSRGFGTTIALKNGERVTVNKFRASYTLWIPESIKFELTSKYNNIEIADFKGVFNFDLYDADIHTGDFADNSSFNAKYSKLTIGNSGNTSFNIYDCEMTSQNLKDVTIISKYSTLDFLSVYELNADSYDDDFEIKNLTGIHAKAHYSSFLLGGHMKNAGFDLYDTDVKGGSYELLSYSAKYSEFVADEVVSLNISSIYDCSVKINRVTDFVCNESKYDDISLNTAVNRISMPNTYDTQLNVNKLLSSFSGFNGDFRYGSVTMASDPALNYRISCETTYGSIAYPEEKFKNNPLTYIEKNSKIQFKGTTDPDAKCEINFTAYDLNFTIK